MLNQITVKIPSKIILSGEHSCVYNQPLVVATIPLFCQLNFSYQNLNLQNYVIEYGSSFEQTISKQLDNICCQIIHYFCIQNLVQKFKFVIQFCNEAPIKMGLGSSAQVILTIFKAFENFMQKQNYEIDKQKNNFEFLKNLEDNFHGKSSGLDILAVQQSIGIYKFTKQEKKNIIEKLDSQNEFFILLISSGQDKDTKKAVSKVKKFLEENSQYKKYIQDIGKQTDNLFQILQSKNLQQKEINDTIKQNQNLLKEFQISTDKIDKITDELRAFQIESKLSGGGLGGFVISVITKNVFQQIKDKLIDCVTKEHKKYFIFNVKANIINRIH